jgi:AmmeMemoRadiSam system protein B
MEMAAELAWRPHLLDYRNSGDTAGDKRRVVGYAAIAYTAGTGAQPPRAETGG